MPVDLVSIRARYRYAMGEVGVNATLLINTGPDVWTSYPGIKMMFRKLRPDELVEPVEQGVMSVMILEEDMPAGITRLKTRDRISTDEGREFTIKKGDFVNREVQGLTFAIEALVKG